jgi:SEC-C motif domain protein
MFLCPCGSGMEFESCCERYLGGMQVAPTAEALMRSRYTAFARKDTAYIDRTWAPETKSPAGEDGAENPSEAVEWLGLEIKAKSGGGPEDSQGVVEFVARCRVNGVDGQLHEVSRFRREGDAWLYVDGEFVGPGATVRNAPKAGRNDPCPCGSGKKFKKCCGGVLDKK